jgi:hypothetical protein
MITTDGPVVVHNCGTCTKLPVIAQVVSCENGKIHRTGSFVSMLPSPLVNGESVEFEPISAFVGNQYAFINENDHSQWRFYYLAYIDTPHDYGLGMHPSTHFHSYSNKRSLMKILPALTIEQLLLKQAPLKKIEYSANPTPVPSGANPTPVPSGAKAKKEKGTKRKIGMRPLPLSLTKKKKKSSATSTEEEEDRPFEGYSFVGGNGAKPVANDSPTLGGEEDMRDSPGNDSPCPASGDGNDSPCPARGDGNDSPCPASGDDMRGSDHANHASAGGMNTNREVSLAVCDVKPDDKHSDSEHEQRKKTAQTRVCAQFETTYCENKNG